MSEEKLKAQMLNLLDAGCEYRAESGKEPPATLLLEYVGEGRDGRSLLGHFVLERLGDNKNLWAAFIKYMSAHKPCDRAYIVSGAWQAKLTDQQYRDRGGAAVKDITGRVDVVVVTCKTAGGGRYVCSRVVGALGTDYAKDAAVEWAGFGENVKEDDAQDRFLDEVVFRQSV